MCECSRERDACLPSFARHPHPPALFWSGKEGKHLAYVQVGAPLSESPPPPPPSRGRLAPQPDFFPLPPPPPNEEACGVLLAAAISAPSNKSAPFNPVSPAPAALLPPSPSPAPFSPLASPKVLSVSGWLLRGPLIGRADSGRERPACLPARPPARLPPCLPRCQLARRPKQPCL